MTASLVAALSEFLEVNFSDKINLISYVFVDYLPFYPDMIDK